MDQVRMDGPMNGRDGTACQDAVLAFLGDPRTFGEPVERIDTHAASVFLTREKAYKLKRAVHFPYLDFSTLEKRRIMCAREVELNKRTAPDIYLATRPIVADGKGGLAFGTENEDAARALDWVVEMRRFASDDLFAVMAREGRLTAAHLRDLADAIVHFHQQQAMPVSDDGVTRPLHVLEGNFASMVAVTDAILPASTCEALFDRSRASLERLAPILQTRAAAGCVRLCHGDLHLGNICLWQGRATPFDCLEFDDELATSDVLYDLAFAVMDLWHRDYRQGAALLFNRYCDMADLDGAAMAVMPLFLSMRAAVRAHVNAALALRLHDAGKREASLQEARGYLDAAGAFLEPRAPCLVAVGGFSGTGKSTLASALAPHLGAAPGARWLRTDVLRKRLAGVTPETRLPAASYTPENARTVYSHLERLASETLVHGSAVIVDGVFSRPGERRAIEALARDAGATFHGLWLEAPSAVLLERVAQRTGDASDATVEVVTRQSTVSPGNLDGWTRIDAQGTPDTVYNDAMRALGF